MGYLQNIEAEIRTMLASEDFEGVVEGLLKEQILKSYKNGLRDGKKPQPNWLKGKTTKHPSEEK